MATVEAGYSIRELDWERDGKAVLAFDASFTTDRIYRVERGDMSFGLVESQLVAPLFKKYDMRPLKTVFLKADLGLAAEIGGALAGISAVKHDAWSRRTLLVHLYVAPEHKGKGIGTALVQRAVAFAKSRKARTLYLETQNVNFPAIQFYIKIGFRLCGIDESLYDPRSTPGETALYFCKDLN